MLSIGLTGGIGSGKSEAARMFSRLGAPVIDADEIAHRVVEPGSEALAEIVASFGKAVLSADGTLDRAGLADIVFEKPELRQRLEAIIHPRVREQIRAGKARYERLPYVIIVIPLLLESGQRDLVDRVLTVNADEPVRIARVKARDNRTETQIRAIIQNQADDRLRRTAADDELDNNGSLEELRLAVQQLHRHYLALSAGDNFM